MADLGDRDHDAGSDLKEVSTSYDFLLYARRGNQEIDGGSIAALHERRDEPNSSQATVLVLDDRTVRMISVAAESEMKRYRRGFRLPHHRQHNIDIAGSPGLRPKGYSETAHQGPGKSSRPEICDQPDQGLL